MDYLIDGIIFLAVFFPVFFIVAKISASSTSVSSSRLMEEYYKCDNDYNKLFNIEKRLVLELKKLRENEEIKVTHLTEEEKTVIDEMLKKYPKR